MDYVIIRKFLFRPRRFHSNCVSYFSDVFPCHASKEREVLVRSIKVAQVSGLNCDSVEVKKEVA
ncbi:hypothetical protein T08_13848 [Trichinella sp. T8]|nr:hypothetical protein T08_13848 [Trichinella sp. T8]